MPEGKKIRVAVIDYDKCQPEGCGNFLCVRVCPANRMGQECITVDEERQKPVIAEEICTGCGICPKKCPFGAISVINLSTALGNPIHQFGKNSFRLYRLPMPKEGAVVGLIGKNAIGKTTTLKVLAGRLIPNLGNYKEEASLENVIEFFRGKGLQAFFEKIKEKGIKISYKPQNVDELGAAAKGRVKDILKRVDERKKLKETAKQLNISSILSHDISSLSGGELQRVAITAAILKDADIYAFDEPSSYLDVSERLRAAKTLRQLAESGKSVLVIEHDLAVLDYLSDYIYIFFGKQGVYGVISSPKGVKNGINEFLQGFIRDENLRFRSKELKFDVRPPHKSVKRRVLAEYPELKKSYSTFSLSVSAGELKEGEVVGILGPNAIGKTTFVKMLAGVEKPDNTKINLKFKVSYKPQYLEPEKGSTVKELFDKIKIDKELFKAEVERRLRIKKLFNNKVEELSGGELQKVAVALALVREPSNILLLDEPSAFIDVEDRLAVAEAIRAVTDKKKKTALVVDHDILFQDYVSDRLIIFEGLPSKKGYAGSPVEMHEGMNKFLQDMDLTFRREESTGRPRANKPDSVKDKEQKQKGEYYYVV